MDPAKHADRRVIVHNEDGPLGRVWFFLPKIWSNLHAKKSRPLPPRYRVTRPAPAARGARAL